MSDPALNYNNTKNTVPVPAGWMIVEHDNPLCTPTTNMVQFWAPSDSCWLELKITAEGAPAEFNAAWGQGTTCLIVRDPNYVAPAPVVVPPTFAAPVAPGLPFAAPSPFPAPVAEAPVYTPPTNMGAAPQPGFPAPVAPVQAAPVLAPLPVLAPIVPQATPMIPLPVVAAPVALPVVQTIPTNVIPFPNPAPVVATQPQTPAAFVAPELPVEATSTADQNEVSAWVAAYEAVKAQIAAFEDVKDELRAKIVKVCFPNGLREGVNKCALIDGRTLNITGVVNRTVDEDHVDTAIANLTAKNGYAPAGLFKTKHVVDKKAFRELSYEDKQILAVAVTEKDGSPQLEVKAAK